MLYPKTEVLHFDYLLQKNKSFWVVKQPFLLHYFVYHYHGFLERNDIEH